MHCISILDYIYSISRLHAPRLEIFSIECHFVSVFVCFVVGGVWSRTRHRPSYGHYTRQHVHISILDIHVVYAAVVCIRTCMCVLGYKDHHILSILYTSAAAPQHLTFYGVTHTHNSYKYTHSSHFLSYKSTGWAVCVCAVMASRTRPCLLLYFFYLFL